MNFSRKCVDIYPHIWYQNEHIVKVNSIKHLYIHIAQNLYKQIYKTCMRANITLGLCHYADPAGILGCGGTPL